MIVPVNTNGQEIFTHLWRAPSRHYMIGRAAFRILDGIQPLVLQSGNIITCVDRFDTVGTTGALSLLQTRHTVHVSFGAGGPDYTEGNMDLCSGRHNRLQGMHSDDDLDLMQWFKHHEFKWSDDAAESSSIVDTDIQITGETDCDYTEDNMDLCSGRSDCSSAPSVVNTPVINTSVDTSMSDLYSAMQTLCSQPWCGLNHDFMQLHVSHPAALCALAVQQASQDKYPILHIYSDGSCKDNTAAWAFVVVAQIPSASGPTFWKYGFAADVLDDTLGPFQYTAMDAEATALIAAAEFLLPLATLEQSIHFHFDAQSVGFGAFGVQATPTYHGETSSRQHGARVMLSFLQQQTRTCPIHVHAHEGNPFNELVDSIATSVRCGWRPTNLPQLCSGKVLQHRGRDWAWLFFMPPDVVPPLQDILSNPPRNARQYAGDPQLHSSQIDGEVVDIHGTINLLSANVATMEYGQDGIPFSHKCRHLMEVCQQGSYDVVAIQESRARTSQVRVDGHYIRIISAGHQGNAGIELWFLKTGFWASHGLTLTPDDLVVWFSNDRLIMADLHWGESIFTFCVVYAPQSGQSDDSIRQWWRNLSDRFAQLPSDRPVFLMGDFNSHVGCVNTDAIGPLAPDVENLAGTLLRKFCDEFQMILPSTYPQWHDGTSHTFIHPKGSRHRLDYIATRQFQQHSICSSWVETDIELANGQCDHLPVALRLQVQFGPARQSGFQRRAVYNRTKARDSDLSQSPLTVPRIPWTCDVNDHWHIARQSLQEQAHQAYPFEKRVPRQQYFDQMTWDAMCHRKALRQEHRAAQREAELCTLKMVFNAWHSSHVADEQVQDWQFQMHVHRLQDALFVHQRNTSDLRFRIRKKHARRQWALTKAAQLQHDLQHGDVFKVLKPKRALAKATKRSLPGLRTQHGQWCQGKKDIALAWERQFGELENAHMVTLSHLLEKSQPRYQSLQLDDLLNIPSVYDLEHAIRGADTSKAPGVDGLGAEIYRSDPALMARHLYPLLLKSALRQQWVVEMSGGWLLPLWKRKGDQQQMQHYRGILLEPVLGRIISRAWRKKISPTMSQWAAQCSMEGVLGFPLRRFTFKLACGRPMPRSSVTT